MFYFDFMGRGVYKNQMCGSSRSYVKCLVEWSMFPILSFYLSLEVRLHMVLRTSCPINSNVLIWPKSDQLLPLYFSYIFTHTCTISFKVFYYFKLYLKGNTEMFDSAKILDITGTFPIVPLRY